VTSLNIFTRDAKLPVRRRSRGKNHRMIAICQLLEGEIVAECHVTDERKTWMPSDRRVRIGDILQSRVIRCDTIADQPIRDREAFENVDLGRVFRLQ
jgi:hypothetical protein